MPKLRSLFLIVPILMIFCSSRVYAAIEYNPLAYVSADSIDQPPTKEIENWGPRDGFDEMAVFFFGDHLKNYDGKALFGFLFTLFGTFLALLGFIFLSFPILGIPIVIIGSILCAVSLFGKSFRVYKRKGKAFAIAGLTLALIALGLIFFFFLILIFILLLFL